MNKDKESYFSQLKLGKKPSPPGFYSSTPFGVTKRGVIISAFIGFILGILIPLLLIHFGMG